MTITLSFSSLILVAFCFSQIQCQGFNLTAIAAVNGSSVLECWSLEGPPYIARGATNYPVGNFTGGFVGVIQPRTYVGQAWAPSVL